MILESIGPWLWTRRSGMFGRWFQSTVVARYEGGDMALGGGPNPECSESGRLSRTGFGGLLPYLDLSGSN